MNTTKIQSNQALWEEKLNETQDTRKFVRVLLPEIVDLYQELLSNIQENKLETIVPDETVFDYVFNDFASKLGFILSRVCVYEMHAAKEANYLQGENPEDRFHFFLNELCKLDNKQAILGKYPPLKENIDNLFAQTLRCFNEFIARLAGDLNELNAQLLKIDSPTLTHIKGSGDTHCQGNQVLMLTFDNKVKTLYKPRSLEIDIKFNHFLSKLNQLSGLDLQGIKTLEKKTYGWCEFISHQSCTNEVERKQYYQELGALIAICYLLNGEDLHSENIIARGPHPVIIDYECFFTPKFKRLENERFDTEPMVTKSLILNFRSQVRPDFSGIDISGMSIKKEQKGAYRSMSWDKSFTDEMVFNRIEATLPQKQNVPFDESQEFTLYQYQDDLKSGFEQMFKTFINNKDSISQELDVFGSCLVRVLLRSTSDYAKTLMESFHPELLFYPEKREAHFDYLIEDNFRVDLDKTFDYEKADMKSMNIPLYWTKAGGEDIYNGFGEKMEIEVIETGLDCVKDNLARFINQEKLDLQLNLIEYIFKAMWLTEKTENSPLSTKSPFETYHPKSTDYESVALDILNELQANHTTVMGDICWPTLNIVHDRVWAAGFTDPSSLFNGNVGIGLVFAIASKLFNRDDYKNIAHECVKSFTDNIFPIDENRPYSIGAFSGLGSSFVALKHIGDFTDSDYSETIAALVDYLPQFISKDEALDIIGGVAGLICSLEEVKDLIAPENLKSLIQQCVDQLFEKHPDPTTVPETEHPISQHPLLGFSHGIAGYVYSLVIAQKYTNDTRIQLWIDKALAYEREHFSDEHQNWPDFRDNKESAHRIIQGEESYMCAWCHGAPGVLLGRLGLVKLGYHDDHIDAEIKAGIETNLNYGFIGTNACLCHGLVGNYLVLKMAHEMGYATNEQLAEAKDKMDTATQNQGIGANFGANPIEIPSFMIGGAGTAYGLLLATSKEKLPNVLLQGVS